MIVAWSGSDRTRSLSNNGLSRRARCDLRFPDRSPRVITQMSTANRSYRSLRDGSGLGAFLAINCQATIMASLRDKRAFRAFAMDRSALLTPSSSAIRISANCP
jgi:hypothetical protein